MDVLTTSNHLTTRQSKPHLCCPARNPASGWKFRSVIVVAKQFLIPLITVATLYFRLNLDQQMHMNRLDRNPPGPAINPHPWRSNCSNRAATCLRGHVCDTGDEDQMAAMQFRARPPAFCAISRSLCLPRRPAHEQSHTRQQPNTCLLPSILWDGWR